jgi:hypothetical protein
VKAPEFYLKIFTAIKQKLRQFLVSLHRPMPGVSTGAGKKHLKKTDYQKNENDDKRIIREL